MPLSAVDPVAALVVVDLQEGLRGAALAPHTMDDVIGRSARLAAAFRARGLPVILVRASDGGPGFSSGRTDRPRVGGPRPEGWDEVVGELAGLGDAVVTKRSVGAFVGTDLAQQLRRRGATQMVVTGVATTMGVESTVRAGHDHDLHVVTVVDAMADRDEGTHRHGVGVTLPRFAETTTTAELLAAIGPASRR